MVGGFAMMTISEIRAALDAFERDGVIQYQDVEWNKEPHPWKETKSPSWDFLHFNYRPGPKTTGVVD